MRKYLSLLTAILMMALTCAGCTPSADTTDTTVADTTESASDTDGTEDETTAQADETTAAETEAETGTPVAGMDSGIVRDGTPKKYFTIRMDDGITQDARIMEILKKYNTDCCTFYINTGLLGQNWAWVGQQFNRPDVTHLRYTRAELQSGIYDGFDVEVHTKTHPSLKNCAESQVASEVRGDASSIERLTGVIPVGMAWPGGDTEWNESNIKTILEKTDIRYGSCTTPTYNFKLPEYFMTWYPTCSFSDAKVMDLAQQFIDAEPTEDMLFYVWCHGYELDLYSSWDQFDELIKMITEAAAEDDSIVLVTNAEFYQLFKDEIPAWKE